jgi:hypothetical protein
MELPNIISWIAIITLAGSYWFQIYKIHVHKEVRDLSMTYHVLLALGFGILIFTAFVEDSTIFLVKQIATFIPVLIIIGQIKYHDKDHWHSKNDPLCSRCNTENEPDWHYCPTCGQMN